jgi:hypothetical protein
MNLRVEIVEEGNQIEAELDPSLAIRLLKLVLVEDRGGIVDAWMRHDRTIDVAEIRRIKNSTPKELTDECDRRAEAHSTRSRKAEE